jgi:hypothetical protein
MGELEFLGQRDDDARWATHVVESVHVLVLGYLADEFGAVGAQASDRDVEAFDGKDDTAEAQRVRWGNRRFTRDQLWMAKLRQFEPPVTIGSPHHHNVDLDTFEPVDAVHSWAINQRFPFTLHAKLGKKALAAARSTTTTLTWSNLLIVMSLSTLLIVTSIV